MVPYPVAFGKNFIYFMLDKTYVSIYFFNKASINPIWEENQTGLKKKVSAYEFYFGNEGGQYKGDIKKEGLKKKAKPMKRYKKLD